MDKKHVLVSLVWLACHINAQQFETFFRCNMKQSRISLALSIIGHINMHDGMGKPKFLLSHIWSFAHTMWSIYVHILRIFLHGKNSDRNFTKCVVVLSERNTSASFENIYKHSRRRVFSPLAHSTVYFIFYFENTLKFCCFFCRIQYTFWYCMMCIAFAHLHLRLISLL